MRVSQVNRAHRTVPRPVAFVVIRDAMQNEECVALARIVMAHREHIIMLEPLGEGTARHDAALRL